MKVQPFLFDMTCFKSKGKGVPPGTISPVTGLQKQSDGTWKKPKSIKTRIANLKRASDYAKAKQKEKDEKYYRQPKMKVLKEVPYATMVGFQYRDTDGKVDWQYVSRDDKEGLKHWRSLS